MTELYLWVNYPFDKEIKTSKNLISKKTPSDHLNNSIKLKTKRKK